ncbi:adenosylcobinamide-GDP ribazoletransferase [Anthocerotibacter panamensis]|uniref:adenosylcobinamide-GDP ribazoletransferase n=1 Tax=Anthocerotibacter panamensis TaxID=2857077 RepID=UPI001C401D50|nr:adenosylcobinamide-GDP ribazoletransferase [Anthocerotibacter panamensis]
MQFLTRLPVGGGPPVTPEALGRSVRYFPLVGLGLGGLLVLVRGVCVGLIPGPTLSLLLVMLLLGLTGMLHFDGFLDSCDGLFAPRTPEQRLEIMRDSRVGSFAVAGGWGLLTLKLIALQTIPLPLIAPALLVGPCLGRWALVVAVVCFPYGREGGLGTAYKQYTSARELVFITLVVLLVGGYILGWGGLLLVAFIFGLTLLMGYYTMAKLPQGLTGDSYGWVTEVCEAMCWLAISLMK